MIKSAEDFLKEYGLSKDEVAWTNNEIEVPIKELIKEYATQFIDLAAEEARVEHIGDFAELAIVDKESILKLKELL